MPNKDESNMWKQARTATVTASREVTLFTALTSQFVIKLLLGSWLVILYYVTVVSTIMALSTHQLQHRIEQIKVNGQRVTISELKTFHDKKQDLERELTDKTGLAEIETQLKQKQTEHTNLLNKERELVLRQYDVRGTDINPTDDTQKQTKLAEIKTEIDINTERLGVLDCEIKNLEHRVETYKSRLNQELKELIEEFNYQGQVSSAKNAPLAGVQQVLKKNPEDTNARNSELLYSGDADCPIHNKAITVVGRPAINKEIVIFSDELSYFNNRSKITDSYTEDKGMNLSKMFSAFKVWKLLNFASIPADMLTLMVVLLTGALGGTISLTRIFLHPSKENDLADYMFLPLLGAVTGFAVYVLAKAGVLIVSDTGQAGGADLSPFFISFIGIMSGMLSDKALATIQRVGEAWFKDAQADKDRYWIGDQTLLSDNDTLYTDLSQLFDVSESRIEGWLSGDVPVPSYNQKLIAAWLNQSQRNLFSGIPPNKFIENPVVAKTS